MSRGRRAPAAAAAVALMTLLAGGCAGPPPGHAAEERTMRRAPRMVAPAARPVQVDIAGLQRAARPDAEDDGPEILEPRRPADDAVVARVGDVTIRKSQVFDRLLENDRRRGRLWVDVLVTDVVVADMARQYEIRPDPEVVRELVDEEEDLLRTQVELELGGADAFPRYLRRQFGLQPDEYRAAVRRDVTRVRYRSLVIRYLAMLEDRVEVRFITNADAEVLADARERVLAGADFAALARRLSDDETRAQGGYLAPFGRGFQHPIAQRAFALEAGEVSPVFPLDEEGSRHALVYCLRRLPRRDQPFAAVRDEIVQGLEDRPVTAFEQSAFAMQYCQIDTRDSGVPPATPVPSRGDTGR